jgi:dienelactone hydrolase
MTSPREPISIRRETISIDRGSFVLEGDLGLPAHWSGPVPAFVLLHPWGAWDRNGSLDPEMSAHGEPIHLFRQLRDRLVPSGVAVLSYDSRFHVCRGRDNPRFGQISFSGLVADAREAVARLRRTEGVHPEQVWLLGISVGTEVAVAVAEQDPSIGGLILLAATGECYARRSHYLAVERKIEWLLQSGLVGPGGTVDLQALEARATERWGWWDLEPDLRRSGQVSLEYIAAVLKAHLDSKLDGLLAGGDEEAPAAFWREWLDNPPAYRRIASYPGPVLILDGGDENTTPLREAHLLERSLAGRRDARLEIYPGLGHLFSARREDGRRTYGPLSEQVLERLALYVKEKARPRVDT